MKTEQTQSTEERHAMQLKVVHQKMLVLVTEYLSRLKSQNPPKNTLTLESTG